MQVRGIHTIDVIHEDEWVQRAADLFAMAVTSSLEVRDRMVLALSGGSTPGPVFDALAAKDLPWRDVIVTQADERVAPEGDSARNLTRQMQAFEGTEVEFLPLPVQGLIRPGVEEYLRVLHAVCDDPPLLDVVHLGLGDDGHTASLLPGDDALEVTGSDVAVTAEYQGHRRITLTRPLLDRARLIIWLVKGESKAEPLRRLVTGDPTIPAGRLNPQRSLILADEAAASLL